LIYLDTTALMKLVTAQPESTPLSDYLSGHTDTVWFTCALTRAELLRAAAAVHPDAAEHAYHVLAGLDTVAVTDRLLDTVTMLAPAPRRILDALHIAAALTAGHRLHTLITYDDELAAAARDHNITTTTPGGTLCFAP
jgi:uncharacterized protein